MHCGDPAGVSCVLTPTTVEAARSDAWNHTPDSARSALPRQPILPDRLLGVFAFRRRARATHEQHAYNRLCLSPFLPDSSFSRSRNKRRVPTSTIDLIAGSNSLPTPVNSYSTVGGDVGMTLLVRTPRCSRSRNLLVITLADMNGLSRRNSENRREPSLNDQRTSGVQQPPIRSMHLDMGQPGRASTFFRNLSTIAHLPDSSFHLVTGK